MTVVPVAQTSESCGFTHEDTMTRPAEVGKGQLVASAIVTTRTSSQFFPSTAGTSGKSRFNCHAGQLKIEDLQGMIRAARRPPAGGSPVGGKTEFGPY